MYLESNKIVAESLHPCFVFMDWIILQVAVSSGG